MALRTVLRSLLAVAAFAAFATAPASAAPPGTGLVRVDSGWLRGSVADDHVTYSAIPYAAPPVGERRWRPPVPPAHWAGVRDATAPSTPCPQAGVAGAEDCLLLDVTVPSDVEAGERLPVLVWLHGGGFSSGAAPEYDGTRLATTGRLVVVTVNYRLGALGFLSAPAIGGGNYGLMDQTAALRWVSRNAARFGGDPHEVTLAGQSAGARAVCGHLAAPMSRGLFHRAVIQSGACDNDVPTLATAQALGTRAMAELGCETAACLRTRTPADLLTTLRGVGQPVNSRAADKPWGLVAGHRSRAWSALRHRS